MATNRILVVEDDASILRLVTAVLTRAGYEIDTATNGRDALEKIERTPYDAVVLDLMMSGSSGFDVLARLRVTDPQHKFVILMSAASPDVVAKAAVSPNVFAALHKPFDLDDLIAAVRACANHEPAFLLNLSASGQTPATARSQRSGSGEAATR